MKRLMFVMAFYWIGAVASLHAQVVVVNVKPVMPLVARPMCPGADYSWVNGYCRWDRKYRKHSWVNGYWVRRPVHRHHYWRGRVY